MSLLLEATSSALLQSLWQFTVIAGMAAIGMYALRSASAAARHRIGIIGLLTAPATFFWSLATHFPGAGGGGVAAIPATGMVAIGGAPLETFQANTEWTVVAVSLWLAGVAAMALRLLGGWLQLRRVIGNASPVEMEDWAPLCRRAGAPLRTALRSVPYGGSPFAAGWLRPVVIVPAATIAGLPAEQLEAILLHELAHLRRFDFTLEVVQRVVEALFFYHPAIWWLNTAVRRERERACDDEVIAGGVDRSQYARALLTVAEMEAAPLLTAGAATELKGRIERLAGNAGTASPASALLALAGIPLMVLLTMVPFPQPAMAQTTEGPYNKWLNGDVVYIISAEERRTFEALKTDKDREDFIVEFWKRRDPTPATVSENEAKEEHYRRLAYAKQRLGGWQTRQAKIYIVYGRPDTVLSFPGEGRELWEYRHVPGVGRDLRFEFVSPSPGVAADSPRKEEAEARRPEITIEEPVRKLEIRDEERAIEREVEREIQRQQNLAHERNVNESVQRQLSIQEQKAMEAEAANQMFLEQHRRRALELETDRRATEEVRRQLDARRAETDAALQRLSRDLDKVRNQLHTPEAAAAELNRIQRSLQDMQMDQNIRDLNERQRRDLNQPQ